MTEYSHISCRAGSETVLGPQGSVEDSRTTRLSVMLLVRSLEYGGAERQAVELMRHLDRDRFDPLVCSLSHDVPLADQLPDRSRDLVVVEKRWKFMQACLATNDEFQARNDR